ncbi:hypothetical protein MFLO_03865 [Listeria floridensis FSL S10-1187]|uniref:MPN domain-containing protein n=1 Tax=Listeria floridensis FSL S10-1187 TaxID=1265817 RepID=A0ABP3B055_9LIST|nr:DNA repair protein RadC [Listeria floridensis]EUJ33247.1 hypothetical protein MFLO_03865 [Listeria floridensis FSL S10-1187]
MIKNGPREKLMVYGASALSLEELVAILLETGSKTESVSMLASRFVMQFRDTEEIHYASANEFQTINGIGAAKASKLAAAIEFGKRVYQEQSAANIVTIKNPLQAVQIVQPELSFLQQEHFHCLFLNTKNQLIHRETIFVGGLNISIVHPREVFRIALKVSAASIICFHNHPSGDPTPSKEDISITKRLEESGKIVGVSMLDHIIIGRNKHLSLKEESYF